MINDDLEQLANRGPYRDPAEVIDSALATAASPKRRVQPRLAAVSVVVVLVAGLVAGLASMRNTDNPATTDPAVVTPVAAPSVEPPASTTPMVATETSCPTVGVSWPDRADGPTMVGATIQSSSIGGTVGGYQLAADPFVFLSRGFSFDDAGELTVQQQAETVPVTFNGYATEVRPPSAGTGGQSVLFVFPPTASQADPCNVWMINANSPMNIDQFVGLLAAVDMELVDERPIGTPSNRDELFLALESSGVNLDTAPASVKSLNGAVWCGMEQREQDVNADTVLDEAARRCFLNAHRSAQPAVFVEEFPTIEGDPIVTVWRTTDGAVEVHVDSSRDAYGAGQWSSQRCPRLTISFPERPEPVPAGYFACSANDPAEPLAGGVDGPVVYASPSDSGEDALGVGTVLLVDGCLSLGDSSGASDPVPLVWQAGTRWDPITSEVLLPDGTRVPIGTSISAGGGYHAPGAISSFVTDPDALSKVAQCASGGVADGVFVVQHPVDIEP